MTPEQELEHLRKLVVRVDQQVRATEAVGYEWIDAYEQSRWNCNECGETRGTAHKAGCVLGKLEREAERIEQLWQP